MKTLAQLLLISIIAGIGILGILPGCDELVTNEYYDTTIMIVRDSSCVEVCHSDIDISLINAKRQWENSAHANPNFADHTLMGDYSLDCGPQCHSHKGFTGSTGNTSHTEIGCFTCHTPHTTWDYTLRSDSTVTLINGDEIDYFESNICFKCHQSTKAKSELVLGTLVIDTTWIQWAMHGSTQGDNFGGYGGYEYPAGTYLSSHRTSANHGCVMCHMDFDDGYTLGGHSLNLRDGSEFLVDGCNRQGCHIGNPYTGIDDINALQMDFSIKFDSLGNLLKSVGLLNDSLLPNLTNYVNDIDAAGALYNYFYIKNDRSFGMHNYKYDSSLIENSIDYLETLIP